MMNGQMYDTAHHLESKICNSRFCLIKSILFAEDCQGRTKHKFCHQVLAQKLLKQRVSRKNLPKRSASRRVCQRGYEWDFPG